MARTPSERIVIENPRLTISMRKHMGEEEVVVEIEDGDAKIVLLEMRLPLVEFSRALFGLYGCKGSGAFHTVGDHVGRKCESTHIEIVPDQDNKWPMSERSYVMAVEDAIHKQHPELIKAGWVFDPAERLSSLGARKVPLRIRGVRWVGEPKREGEGDDR